MKPNKKPAPPANRAPKPNKRDKKTLSRAHPHSDPNALAIVPARASNSNADKLSMKDMMSLFRINNANISDSILQEDQYDDETIVQTEVKVRAAYLKSSVAFLEQIKDVCATYEEDPEERDKIIRVMDTRLRVYRTYIEKDNIAFTIMGFLYKCLTEEVVDQIDKNDQVAVALLRSKYVTDMSESLARHIAQQEGFEDKTAELVVKWNLSLQFMLAVYTRDVHYKEVVFLMPIVNTLLKFDEITGNGGDDEAQQQAVQSMMAGVFQKQMDKFGVDQKNCNDIINKMMTRIPALNDNKNAGMVSKLIKLMTAVKDPKQIEKELPNILGQEVTKEFVSIMREHKMS